MTLRNLLFVLFCNLALITTAHAQSCQLTPSDTLKIGITHSPPFTIYSEEDGWQGLSVELWRMIAPKLGLRWQLCENQPDQQPWSVATGITAVQQGELDLFLGALTITSEREKSGDFSLPFFHTGLSIATRPNDSNWDELLEWVTNPSTLMVLAFLVIAVPILAILILFLERHQDQSPLQGSRHYGFANSLLWVTLLCTGRAGAFDMKSFPARVLATLLSFAGVTVIASLVAVATSSTVTSSMDQQVQSLSDIRDQKVVVVSGTNVQTLLNEQGIRTIDVATLDEALSALTTGKADAVVHDRPALQYSIHMMSPDRRPLLHDALLDDEFYSFYLQQGSPLLEPINQTLPNIIADHDWHMAIKRYLGAAH